MSVLSEIQRAVEEAATTVAPSVVGVGRGWGSGCGVIVADGTVVTSAHSVRAEAVLVTLADGRGAEGRLVGADADADVGVVAVETYDAPPLEWGDAAGSATAGTPVLAVARPGGRGLRVTLGFVSTSDRAPRRRGQAWIEHTAPVARGSSGSALVDLEGRLLGLNALRLEGGLVLALAATRELRERIDRIARGEAPARPRLGIAVVPPRVARRMRRSVGLPELDGLLVRGVDDGTPAERAGIERGDLIVAVRDRPITAVGDLFDALDDAGPGESLPLRVVRGTEERAVVVALGEDAR